MTTDGKFDGDFVLPSKATLPKSMVPGCWPREICACDGKLWVAEMAANKIACVETDGKIKEFDIPTSNSQPYCVAGAADKSIWFTESDGNKIGRLDPATGKVTEFSIPTANSHTRELTIAADGSVWFAENMGNKIGKLDPASGKISEFAVPTAGSQPIGIVAGSDGNVWFCEFKVSKIGRITPEGKITEFDLPGPARQPFCLTSGPDGNIWVALQENRIARLDVKALAAK
jgi:virginiamycin B lyase